MTYRDIWRRLTAVYAEGEAKAVARALLEDGYGMAYADIITGGVERLSAAAAERLERDVKRLEKGEPVQYVTGKAAFKGRTFHVEPETLIPRPETERLCELVEEELKGIDGEKRILDIGTGTGCIAITLALEVERSRVEAWEISPFAKKVANENAALLGAEVNVVTQDAKNPPLDNAVWDAVVSNPPYVCPEEIAGMDMNVLDYEPAIALFVPDHDPLVYYRHIAEYAAHALKPGGLLAFEINRRFAAETEELLRTNGFRDVRTEKDIFGNDRYVICRR